MKKLICFLAVFSLCLALFAGCGNSAAESAVSAEASAESAEAVSEAETAAVTPAAEEPEAAPEASVQEEAIPSAEEEEEVEPSYTLPISEEPLTYTLWMTYAPFAGELVDTENMQDMTVFRAIADATNINFDITAANGGAEQDNFNLMIAGGDYCDIITNMNNYTTGKEGAVDDGIIQDLADILPEACPIYWSYLSSDANTLMSAYTDSGYMPSICILAMSEGEESQGLVIRQDWLDEFGMEVPATYDELLAYLETAYNTYNAGYYLTNTDGIIQELGAGLNIYVGGWSVEDDTVKYGYAQDEFKTYLSFMNTLYEENIISKDFMANSVGDLSGTARQEFAAGTNSMVLTTATNTADIIQYADGAEVPMVVQPYVSEDGTTEPHVLTSYVKNLIKHDDTWSFTTGVEDIQPLLELVEYLYSDEGFLTANYGVEGETYTLDSDGNPQWTDLVANNPDGVSFFFASYCYATNAATAFLPFLSDLSKTFVDFNDNQWEVYEDLKNLSDGAYNIPSYASMNSDESSEYAAISSDLDTYTQTEILKFITGELNVDSDFDSFVQGMYDLGLQDMIDLEQAAYDRAAEKAAQMGV